jgi:hypothetical protein
VPFELSRFGCEAFEVEAADGVKELREKFEMEEMTLLAMDECREGDCDGGGCCGGDMGELWLPP